MSDHLFNLGVLMEFISKLYNHYFGPPIPPHPPIDIPHALEQVRLTLSAEEKVALKHNLTLHSFREELLCLILTKEEDQAIDYVLKIAIILEDHLAETRKIFLDFLSPLPKKSLACGRSISHISNLLRLNKLTYLLKNFFNTAEPS